jgi:hypothetical protein
MLKLRRYQGRTDESCVYQLLRIYEQAQVRGLSGTAVNKCTKPDSPSTSKPALIYVNQEERKFGAKRLITRQPVCSVVFLILLTLIFACSNTFSSCCPVCRKVWRCSPLLVFLRLALRRRRVLSALPIVDQVCI